MPTRNAARVLPLPVGASSSVCAALALADLNNDGYDEVVFAPMFSPIPHQGQSVRSHIHVLTSTPAGDGLADLPLSTIPVAGTVPADDFVGFGACGLAILDLPTTPPINKAIVVTTTNGELAVFSMFSTFGTPQDITLASLRVEHVFAADAHTRSVLEKASTERY